MMFVLAIGNYVNHDIHVGQHGVRGIKFESLMKLRDFRATWAKDISLVHVLVAHVGHPKLRPTTGVEEESIMAVLDRELSGVAEAAKADLVSLRRAVTDISCDVSFLETERSQLEKWVMDRDELDVVLEVLDSVLEKARNGFAAVEAEIAEYDKSLLLLLTTFGEKPGRDKDKVTERFIDFVNQFHIMFRSVWKEIMTDPRRFTTLQQMCGTMPKQLSATPTSKDESHSPQQKIASGAMAIANMFSEWNPLDALELPRAADTAGDAQVDLRQAFMGKGQLPKSAMGRKIHWAEIDESPIFQDIHRLMNPKQVYIDEDRITALFAQRAEPVKVTKKDKVIDQIKVFDDNRARNMMIAMHKLRCDMEDLAPRIAALRVAPEDKPPAFTCEVNSALQAMCKPEPNRGDKVLTDFDLLELVGQVVPTPDERDKLVSLPMEKIVKLRTIEKQVRPLAHVPRLQSRLRVLSLRLSFEANCTDLASRIRKLRIGLTQPLESKALKEVLTTVLMVCNYINHGWQPSRPQKDYAAMAFKVESLLRLKDFRSSAAQGVSLMHFVLAHLGHPVLRELSGYASEEESESIVDRLNRELEDVAAGAKADFGELRKTLTCLREEVKFLETERAQMDKFGCALVEPGDEGCVARVVDDTLNDSQRHLTAVQQELDVYDELSAKLLESFGEKGAAAANVRDTHVKAFFGQLQQGLGMLSQAWAELTVGAKGPKFALLSAPIPEEMMTEVEKLKERFPPPPAPASARRSSKTETKMDQTLAVEDKDIPSIDATPSTSCSSDADGRGHIQPREEKENDARGDQVMCPRRQSRSGGTFGSSSLSSR
jgi:hypothetical protein